MSPRRPLAILLSTPLVLLALLATAFAASPLVAPSKTNTARSETKKHAAPTMGKVARLKATSGKQSQPIAFAVAAADGSTDNLLVSAVTNNSTLLPQSGISVSGTSASRILTVTPTSGQSGVGSISLSVTDGVATTTQVVIIEVSGAPTLYLATMTPQPPAISTGAGIATLRLSADETYATLKFDYSNLSSPKTGEHIHGPAAPGANGGILFDIDTAPVNADGSYTWTFVPVGTNTVADQVNAIKSGLTYINIHTSSYPNGEIRGQFLLSTGSQTFTPPPAPPPLPSGPPTATDAGRFLTQATFGPTEQDIALVRAMGIDAWLQQQFEMPPTLTTDIMGARGRARRRMAG